MPLGISQIPYVTILLVLQPPRFRFGFL